MRHGTRMHAHLHTQHNIHNIRVGPDEGQTKMGGWSSGSLSSLIVQNPGVYPIFRLKFRGFISEIIEQIPEILKLEINFRNFSLKIG